MLTSLSLQRVEVELIAKNEPSFLLPHTAPAYCPITGMKGNRTIVSLPVHAAAVSLPTVCLPRNAARDGCGHTCG